MPAPIPANEAKRLEALRRYQILDTPTEQIFDDFAFIASVICQTPIATMTLVDADRQWFKARAGLDKIESPREHAFCAHTILGDEVMIVEDAATDKRFADNPLVTAEPHIRFYAGAPLIDREGLALGSICVIDRKPRPLTREQSRALEAIARQIISQLEFRKTCAALAEALTELKTLHGLLPICSHCKGVRNDAGYWESVEGYLQTHTEAVLSHGICPKCLEEYHPHIYEKMRVKGMV